VPCPVGLDARCMTTSFVRQGSAGFIGCTLTPTISRIAGAVIPVCVHSQSSGPPVTYPQTYVAGPRIFPPTQGIGAVRSSPGAAGTWRLNN